MSKLEQLKKIANEKINEPNYMEIINNSINRMNAYFNKYKKKDKTKKDSEVMGNIFSLHYDAYIRSAFKPSSESPTTVAADIRVYLDNDDEEFVKFLEYVYKINYDKYMKDSNLNNLYYSGNIEDWTRMSHLDRDEMPIFITNIEKTIDRMVAVAYNFLNN